MKRNTSLTLNRVLAVMSVAVAAIVLASTPAYAFDRPWGPGSKTAGTFYWDPGQPAGSSLYHSYIEIRAQSLNAPDTLCARARTAALNWRTATAATGICSSLGLVSFTSCLISDTPLSRGVVYFQGTPSPSVLTGLARTPSTSPNC
jgi:hypothetical protein